LSWRSRIFRKSRPFIRPLDIEKDAWVLWAAYDLGSFPSLPKEMKKDEFFSCLASFAGKRDSILMVEDDHRRFRDKRGPVAMISVDNYGWRIEPQIDFFFWASKRNRLRAAASFLQMTRHSREVGVCVVRVNDRDSLFCEHLRGYDLLFPCGKIPYGSPDGDESLFYLKGKKTSEERKAA
jgi:hypothetical protein